MHLWAVASPPLAFQTRGPLGGSPSVATLAAPVRGYGEFLYLNRGYAFFAPDPGPSHLIQAAYTDTTGKVDEELFPDRTRQWPRLLYHRHFMLTEFLHEIYQPPGPPPQLREVDANAARAWSAARGRYESVRQSYVNHLKSIHGESRDVAIRRIEHRIPSFVELMARPTPLSDPSLYGVLADVPIEFQNPDAGDRSTPEVLSTVGDPEVDRVNQGDVVVEAESPAASPSVEAASGNPASDNPSGESEPRDSEPSEPATSEPAMSEPENETQMLPSETRDGGAIGPTEIEGPVLQ